MRLPGSFGAGICISAAGSQQAPSGERVWFAKVVAPAQVGVLRRSFEPGKRRTHSKVRQASAGGKAKAARPKPAFVRRLRNAKLPRTAPATKARLTHLSTRMWSTLRPDLGHQLWTTRPEGVGGGARAPVGRRAEARPAERPCAADAELSKPQACAQIGLSAAPKRTLNTMVGRTMPRFVSPAERKPVAQLGERASESGQDLWPLAACKLASAAAPAGARCKSAGRRR